MHYQDIIAINSSCLIPFLFGETETGIKINIISTYVCVATVSAARVQLNSKLTPECRDSNASKDFFRVL